MPEEGFVRSHLRYLWWLAGLLALAAIATLFQWTLPAAPSAHVPQVRTDIPQGFPQGAPAPMKADFVPAQHGFQYLVSYADRGFQPATLTVKKGETVRFTNTSNTALQISLTGAQSPALAHGQYWEYTFTKTGTIRYQSQGGSAGSVTVKGL